MVVRDVLTFLENKSVAAAAVAVFLWVLTRWYETWLAWQHRRQDHSSLIRSLYAEVDFNTRDLQFFLENSADLDAIEKRLRSVDNALPHVTDAHHTIIYSTRVGDLHHLSNDLTARLVTFYGLLDKIKAQIDGINLPSFVHVSVEGKITVLARISAQIAECEAMGQSILREFSEQYPGFELVRYPRRLMDTKQQ